MRTFAAAALFAACVTLAVSVVAFSPEQVPSSENTAIRPAPGFVAAAPLAPSSSQDYAGDNPDTSYPKGLGNDTGGGVLLLASSELVRQMWQWCRENPDPWVPVEELASGDRPDTGVDRGCSWRYWSVHTDLLGPQEALARVLRTRLEQPGFVPECHHSLHGVGQRAAIILGPEKALELTDPSCQAGYIHGVIQEWTTMGEGLDGVADICSPLLEDAQLFGPSYAFCGHGLGHALSLRHPDSLRAVVSLCETALPPMLTDACVEGAVMEFSGVDHVTEVIKRETGRRPSDNVTDADRLNVCDAVKADGVRERCWMRIFMLFEMDVRRDQVQYIARCSNALREIDQIACLASWAEQATSSNPVWGPSDPQVVNKANGMFAECDALGVLAAVNRCIIQVVEIIWRDEPASTSTPSFCPQVEPRWKETCLKGDQLGAGPRSAA